MDGSPTWPPEDEAPSLAHPTYERHLLRWRWSVIEQHVPTGHAGLSIYTRSPGARGSPKDPRERTRLIVGAGWMFTFSVLLFTLPLVNGLIAGWIGGSRMGSLRRALAAALAAMPLVALGLWLILIFFAMPILGLYAGVTPSQAILLSVTGLLLGALMGGLFSQLRPRRRLLA